MGDFKGYESLIRSKKGLSDYDFLQNLSNMTQNDLERIVSDASNYTRVFQTEVQMLYVFEYLLKNNPSILEKHANLKLWERYAKIKGMGFTTIGMLAESDIGNSLFSQDKLDEYAKSKLFRIGVLPQLTANQKTSLATKNLVSLTAPSISQTELDIASDTLLYLYGEMGPKHSRIKNMSSEELNHNLKDELFRAIDHNDLNNDQTNKVSLASYFIDNKIAQQRILQNFGLLSGLSVEDRNQLFAIIEPNSIGEVEYQNITKLLFNGYLTRFPDWVFKNKSYLKNLIEETNITDFKKIIKTMRVTNPEVCASIVKLKDIYLDKKLFKSGKVDKMSFAITTYAGGDIDTYSELFAYRYFKTNMADVLLASKLIQDSINSIPELKEHVSPEGVRLINALSLIADKNNGGHGVEYSLSKLSVLSNARLFQNLKEIADEYETTKGEINLNGIMDRCRAEYGRNLGQRLTRKNSPGVKRKVVNGTEVYDLTECDDLHLLVHSSHSDEIPEVKDGMNQLISMSLLDNNHLQTYINDYIFGYDDVGEEDVIHAYISDSGTGSDKGVQLLMYERITNLTPVYTDIETFMNATKEDHYNEIKIKASPNYEDKQGKKIMIPSYILFKSNDISAIPDNIVSVAKNLGINIYVINTEKIKTKTYSPVIKKEEITQGFFKS